MAVDAFLEWIGDGVQRGEESKYILSEYAGLAYFDEPAAVRILRMPFLEEVEYSEHHVVRLLRELLPRDKETLDWILGHPTLEGGITDAQTADVFLLRLERKDPAAASAIQRLPWTQAHDEALLDLIRIALNLPLSFQALMARTWVQDGITSPEREVLNGVSNRSWHSDEQAAALVGMPFLDVVDETDRTLVRAIFQSLFRQPYFVTETIARRPDLRGGITDADRATVALLLLEARDRRAADAMRGLRWLRDGIQPAENYAFWLLWDGAGSEGIGTIFWALLARPWMRDDVTALESDAINVLTSIYYGGGASSEVRQLIGMPFLDSIESADIAIVRTVAGLPDRDRRVTLAHLSQGEGITADYTPATLALLALERRSPDLAATLRALPWVEDGIDRFEEESVSVLATVSLNIPTVLGMPFLQSRDSLDVAALLALEALPRSYLDQVLSHSSLSGGITDDWTNIVASIGMIGSRPDLIDVLLDPARMLIEERVLTLPLAGRVRLSVIRPGARASEVAESPAMDLLEQAIRSQEEFMGVAFPLDHAILLDADSRRFPGAHGIAGIIASPWIEDRGLIAHEMAHTYWRDETPWLNEGGASFLDVISLRAYDGTPLPDSELPCTLFENLYDLERSDLGFEAVFGSGCPYFLGRGIFRELYERLGTRRTSRGSGTCTWRCATTRMTTFAPEMIGAGATCERRSWRGRQSTRLSWRRFWRGGTTARPRGVVVGPPWLPSSYAPS